MDKKDGMLFIVNNEYDIIVIDEKNLANCINYINANNIKKVSIDWEYYKAQNLEFLSQCPSIIQVGIDSHLITDYSGLLKLPKLEVLSIIELAVNFDISLLPKLVTYYGGWDSKLKNLNNCVNLKHLSLTKYKNKDNNLKYLSTLYNLEELILTQSSIHSLEGCDKFKNLKKLGLRYMRNLEYLDGLEVIKDSLIEIELHKCPKIKNIDNLCGMSNLEILEISDCGDIQSLDFIRTMPKLRRLCFANTNILDGDLSPCIGLEHVGFFDKKHYSHKFKDLNPHF